MQRRGREQAAYRRLSAELRSAIEEGRFGNGGRLLTEAELGEEYGVSRHTVRQAFQSLVADGLVYRVPGRPSTIDCQPGEAILHSERLYHDADGTPVELAISHYNPRRYSYRLEMRRRTTP